MFTHIHTQWLWLARPLWSGAGAKSKPTSGTVGDLCLVLELWRSPDLASKYTAASRNSTLSSREARHGKCRRNKKDGEAVEIYVLIHICGRELFLNAFNTLTVKKVPGKKCFKSESEREKLQCNSLFPNKTRIICCNVMISCTTRCLENVTLYKLPCAFC